MTTEACLSALFGGAGLRQLHAERLDATPSCATSSTPRAPATLLASLLEEGKRFSKDGFRVNSHAKADELREAPLFEGPSRGIRLSVAVYVVAELVNDRLG